MLAGRAFKTEREKIRTLGILSVDASVKNQEHETCDLIEANFCYTSGKQ